MPRELDEDDVRIRPGRGSRPRTRTRPAHEDASDAQVVTVDRGRFRLRLEGGDHDGHLMTAVRARELGRRAVVVGDHVSVVGDLTGGPDALGRIVRVQTRTSLLRRTPDDTDPMERPVVAKAEV
ncbi:MAG: rsgA 2, partial [Frankiales bacterium]|nr:rsgA 2 [Frankiales bacterium]